MARSRPPSLVGIALLCLLGALGLCACGPGDDAVDAVDAVADEASDSGAVARLVDPLSMPSPPTHALSDFSSAQACKTCHPGQFEEWSASRHAFAMIDPVYRALVKLRQQHFGGQQDAFCTQCHSSIGTRSGDIQPNFDFEQLAPVTLEGVTCEACHKAAEILRDHNAGQRLDPAGPMCGNLTSVTATPAHASATTPHMGEARFCGSCHDVQEVDGLPLERPYQEWLASPAKAAGKPCQSCHMPTYSGTAAVGGPARDGLHRHRFIGVEPPVGAGTPLTPEVRKVVEAEIEALLASAAGLTLALPALPKAGETFDLVVTIDNRIGAHSLPTGSTFLRQCWLEVEVRDDAGALLYVSGDLDANGDLRDHWSKLDPYGDGDLVTLSSQLIDAAGNPTLFSWLASEHRRNAVPAGHERTTTYFVPVPAAAKGALSVRVRLRFRAYAPFLLRLLGQDALVDEVPIHDLAEAVTAVDLSP